eukprot:m.182004 g.182004  ORF g.182004 m.182004 type:complete len:755 (-) comp14666_c0_seq7:4629-6893(-)
MSHSCTSTPEVQDQEDAASVITSASATDSVLAAKAQGTIAPLLARVRAIDEGDAALADVISAWAMLCTHLSSPASKAAFVAEGGVGPLVVALNRVDQSMVSSGYRLQLEAVKSLGALAKEASYSIRRTLLDFDLFRPLCLVLKKHTQFLQTVAFDDTPTDSLTGTDMQHLVMALHAVLGINVMCGWGSMTTHYANLAVNSGVVPFLMSMLNIKATIEERDPVPVVLRCLSKLSRCDNKSIIATDQNLHRFLGLVDPSNIVAAQMSCALLTELCTDQSISVRLMIMGLVPQLLALITALRETVHVTEAVACLANLTLNDSVRALVSTQLMANTEHVKSLVSLLSVARKRTAGHAAVACAMLMLEEANFPLLESAGALEGIEYLLSGAALGNGNMRFDAPDIEQTLRMAPLLKPSAHPLLAGVFAYHSQFRHTATADRPAVRYLLKTKLQPVIRSLAFHPVHSVRAVVHKALFDLGDELLIVLKDSPKWLLSLELQHPNTSSKLLAKEGVTVAQLLDPALTEEDVRCILFDSSFSKLHRGDVIRMLSSIRQMRQAHAQDCKALAETIAAYDHSVSSRTQESTQSDDIQDDMDSHSGATVSPNTSIDQGDGVLSTKGRCEVFISYSWANKGRVARIRDLLEQSGITCWMDEVQMSGGQQLYEEIDRGVTAAKIFLACISDDYATSKNCQREIQLAADRNKLILPIWVADIAIWPPTGPTAPLLAGRLYIKCSSTSEFRKNQSIFLRAIKRSIRSTLV